MNQTKSHLSNFIVFGIPICLLALLVVLTKSPFFQLHPEKLSIAVTVDMLLIVPVIYFLLIRKHTKIPNYSVLSFFVLGVVILSAILPSEHQEWLSMIKTWLLPVLEIGIFTFILYKVRKSLLRYRATNNPGADFYDTVKTTIANDFPKKIAAVLTMEIAVFYYGFLYWKKRVLNSNEFSYHRNSGTIAVLAGLILIIGIETYVLHVLLIKWSVLAAWIVSGLSIYSGIQIFGFLKSIQKRPILVTDNAVHLRYGILSEARIAFKDIIGIEITSTSIDPKDATQKLSPLGELESHNMIIHLAKEHTLYGLYGTTKKYKSLAFFVDEPQKLKDSILNQIAATDPKNPL